MKPNRACTNFYKEMVEYILYSKYYIINSRMPGADLEILKGAGGGGVNLVKCGILSENTSMITVAKRGR